MKHSLFILFAAISVAACAESTAPRFGTIAVTIRTMGSDLDNGYFVRVNDELIQVGANTAFDHYRDPGSYSVSLQGIAGNCLLSEPNARQIELSAGDRVEVSYNVDCAATGVDVSVITEGLDTPPNYQIDIDGLSFLNVKINGNTSVTRMGIGNHEIVLNLPGENCASTGVPRAVVTVVNREITPVAFSVRCDPPVRRERIAYVTDTIQFSESFGRLSLMDPDGTHTRRIGFGYSPSWSPDGTTLVYSTTRCDFYYGCFGGLSLIDPEVMRSSVLINAITAVRPRWSPVDDAIAFFDLKTEILHLIFAKTPTDHRTVLVQGVSRIRDPSWSPDGQLIIASCIATPGNYDICTFRRDGSELKVLTTNASLDTEPAWSSDGGSIAFTTTPFAGAASRIAIMDADGTNQKDLVAGSSPAWSRDGTKIIFARTDGLYIMNRDGSDVKRFTTGSDYAAAWRP